MEDRGEQTGGPDQRVIGCKEASLAMLRPCPEWWTKTKIKKRAAWKKIELSERGRLALLVGSVVISKKEEVRIGRERVKKDEEWEERGTGRKEDRGRAKPRMRRWKYPTYFHSVSLSQKRKSGKRRRVST